MNAIHWLVSAVQWLQTNGRWDLLTLGLALATFIYVGVAVASSIRSDVHARSNRAKAKLRVASLKRTGAKPGTDSGT